MTLRRLLPGPPAALTPDEAMAGLDLAARGPSGRPWVVLSMVSTLDGRAAVGGSSRPIGDAHDLALLLALRTQVDAVLVGAATVRAERYGPLVRDPARRARRVRAGLAPVPLAAVVAARPALPLDLGLLRDPDSRVLVLTPAPEAPPAVAARVEVARLGPGPLRPAEVLARLHDEHGVRSVLCEGGPRLNAALLAAGLVDELFLALAPTLAGGPENAIVAAAPGLGAPVELALVRLLEGEGALYARYEVRRPG